jgi:hypothetical protein
VPEKSAKVETEGATAMTTEKTELQEFTDDLLVRLQGAWPDERLHWDETPLELVTRLIDERDDTLRDVGEWAQERWNEEVRDRPNVNIYRHPIDTTWRQVMRHCGVEEPK